MFSPQPIPVCRGLSRVDGQLVLVHHLISSDSINCVSLDARAEGVTGAAAICADAARVGSRHESAAKFPVDRV